MTGTLRATREYFFRKQTDAADTQIIDSTTAKAHRSAGAKT
jgi:hypothetical protein